MPAPSSRSPAASALTRRDFLWRVARYGGGAVLGSLFALDLFARDDSGGRPQLAGRAPAKKKRVIVLGGGVAGLATAYELGLIGYDCTVLEARSRPGGRNWTIRAGTEETELGGEKQVCRFDAGLFINGGPMRIAHHHATTLAYCREFGIPLVVFPNTNEAAYLYREGFPRVRLREVRSDWRGYTAELLAKVVRQGQLDTALSADDRERLIEYLRSEGRLDSALIYPRHPDATSEGDEAGNARGYAASPATGDIPLQPSQPLDLELLVKSGYVRNIGRQDFNQEATMLTPAGGMDRIAYAFAEKLGRSLVTGAVVTEARRTADGGVRVVYTDRHQHDAHRELTADFCVCTLPPTYLAKLPADFSPETKAALGLARPSAAGKIGLQFKRRFWEEDDGIYGGISSTSLPISQIGYPFDGYGSRGKGVVLGYYNFGHSEFDALAPAERERRALDYGAKIHPQYPAEFENSFSVAWSRIPYNEMSWTGWSGDGDFDRMQRALADADGPFYFAGDWLSHFNAWQAGAFVAAHRTCHQLHTRAQAS